MRINYDAILACLSDHIPWDLWVSSKIIVTKVDLSQFEQAPLQLPVICIRDDHALQSFYCFQKTSWREFIFVGMFQYGEWCLSQKVSDINIVLKNTIVLYTLSTRWMNLLPLNNGWVIRTIFYAKLRVICRHARLHRQDVWNQVFFWVVRGPYCFYCCRYFRKNAYSHNLCRFIFWHNYILVYISQYHPWSLFLPGQIITAALSFGHVVMKCRSLLSCSPFLNRLPNHIPHCSREVHNRYRQEEEINTENEHLRAKLPLKNIERNNLRSRTVQLRSMAWLTGSKERALYRVVLSAFNKLEEALSEVHVSRKKCAHVRVAET